MNVLFYNFVLNVNITPDATVKTGQTEMASILKSECSLCVGAGEQCHLIVWLCEREQLRSGGAGQKLSTMADEPPHTHRRRSEPGGWPHGSHWERARWWGCQYIFYNNRYFCKCSLCIRTGCPTCLHEFHMFLLRLNVTLNFTWDIDCISVWFILLCIPTFLCSNH